MVSKAPSANLPAMLVAQLLPFVKNLSARKWTDEDIVEDIVYLRDELNANFESLTCVYLSCDAARDAEYSFAERTTNTRLSSSLVISRGHPCTNQNCFGKRMLRNSMTRISNS